MTLGPAGEALVRQYAHTLVGKRGSASAARVLALRARPDWRGPDAIEVPAGEGGTVRVLVRGCMSSLAVREAMTERAPEDYLIVVTDRTDADLGLDVLARCFNQHVETMDLWAGVLQSFRARTLDPSLRRLTWPAEPLLTNAPPAGWPPPPTELLTRDHALTHLATSLLSLPSTQLDPSGLLTWTLDDAAVGAFRDQLPAVQSGLVAWIVQSVGAVAGIAVRSATVGHAVDAIALGLAADVLWPGDGAPTPELIAARVRLERWTGVRDLSEPEARAWADAARGVMQRMSDNADPLRPGVLLRAAALFDDLGLPTGAEASAVLPAGYDARLRDLATALVSHLQGSAPDASAEVEKAFTALLAHENGGLDRRTAVARMAVRLSRWLRSAPDDIAPTLLTAAQNQTRVNAWIDRAAADIWVGSTDPVVATAWSRLYEVVRARRAEVDRRFATLLADATSRGNLPDGLVPVEDAVRTLLLPMTRTGLRALLVVIDGMSAAVAAELADEALETGWYEVVPSTDGRRTCLLAALPTLTRYSRTSLFAGELREGQQSDEKRLFPALAGGGQLFHKSDLVGAAGHALPAAILDAMSSSAPLVAVVLNTVDDALAKHDPGGTDWTLSSVQHLAGLLEEARRQDRVVVLTSDHGHVVERGSAVASYPGAEARWRPVVSGPVDTDTEVALAGRRVLAPGGEFVAPWREDLRYGQKRAGYHGGASAAEVVIPLVVLTSQPDALTEAGWAAAAPQAPSWWNDPVADTPRAIVAPAPAATASRPPRTSVPGQEELGFEPVPAPPAALTPASGAGALVDDLLAGPGYQSQRARAGARAMDDTLLRSLLEPLLAHQGRLHRDTLAGLAGVAAVRITSTLTALRRQLNIEGYDVISIDPDQVTVILDETLLREQFDLPSGT